MPEVTVLPWSGEGPPPAGTVCEVDGSAGESGFGSCTILYSSSNVMVWQYIGSDFENCSYVGEREFRPIRTPEQIAAIERDNAINQMIGFVKDHPGGRHGVRHLPQLQIQEEACCDLYDAGYRKQVTP